MSDTITFGVATLPDAAAHALSESISASGGGATKPPGGRTVILKALSTNVGDVILGHDTNVAAANGYPLAKGEAVEIEVINPGKIFLRGAAADKVAWGVLRQ